MAIDPFCWLPKRAADGEERNREGTDLHLIGPVMQRIKFASQESLNKKLKHMFLLKNHSIQIIVLDADVKFALRHAYIA